MSKKVLLAEFKHETNSFCPIPADRAAFAARSLLFGAEITERYRGVENEIGAFVTALGSLPGWELTPCFAVNAMPSGPVTAEVYELAAETLLRTVREEGPFDAVLLGLHGAMVADGHPDGEGDLLERLRAAVGPALPIVATLDLHANITEKMARCATALLPYENYPHTDIYHTGLLAAGLLRALLEGKQSPAMAYRRIPYLLPLFPTEFPEIARFHALARTYEARPGVLFARVAHGFFPADIAEMGMSVVVLADGDDALAARIADELVAAVWAGRDTLRRRYVTLDAALDAVGVPGDGPLVLADASDNPGAGGIGDTTHLLRRVLERGITGSALAALYDREAVRRCTEAGVGATLTLPIGGNSDPAFSGGPLTVTGTVECLSAGLYRNRDEMNRGLLMNMGPTAVLNVGGNRVILCSVRTQPLDLEVFRSCGIAPEKQALLLVKSAVHYRNSYGKVARRMIDLALPGYAVPDPAQLADMGIRFSHWKD